MLTLLVEKYRITCKRINKTLNLVSLATFFAYVFFQYIYPFVFLNNEYIFCCSTILTSVQMTHLNCIISQFL